MIQAVLFDLGGTLVDYGPKSQQDDLNTAGLKNVYNFLKEKGNSLPAFEKFSKKLTRALKVSWLRTKITSRELDAPGVVKKTLAKMNVLPSEDELKEIAWLWYQPLSERASLLPNVNDVLSEIKKRQIDMGIISNTVWKGRFLMDDLKRLGILDYFEILLFSSETRIRKPAGLIFDYACKQIGHIRQKSIMVGNDLENDVYGALNAGLSAVLIGSKFRKPENNIPYYEIEKLPQLFEILDEMNKSEG